GIQATTLVKEEQRLGPRSLAEQRHDLLPRRQVHDWGIDDRVINLPELTEDPIDARQIVEARGGLAEEVERVVVALVPPLVLSPEPPLERLVRGRLDRIGGRLSHATRARRRAPVPRRRRD